MRPDALRFGAAAVLTAGLLAWGSLPDSAEAGAVRAPMRRLLRLDLLERPPWSDIHPRRNIFVRGAEVEPAASLAQAAAPSPEETAPQEELAPEIRYIGYVSTAGRRIALIFAGGQVAAAAEGDLVGGLYRVLKIGPQSVELVGPGEQSLTVSIEGEKE